MSVNLQVHRRIVDASSLMEVDEQSARILQHERRLHARHGRERRGEVSIGRALEEGRDLRHLRVRVAVLLRLIVRRNPPRQRIARQVEARTFLDDREVRKRLRLALRDDLLSRHEARDALVLFGRKLVAETESLVENTEPHVHATPRRLLHKRDKEFVMVVTNLLLLAPDGLPRLVRSRAFDIRQLEVAPQVRGLASVKRIRPERLDVKAEP